MPNLIGTAPDQVPVNGFLGNMAFQNKEGVVTDLLSTTALTVTGTASFAGAIATSLGSAAAPSYTFIGDTNTGIFSPGADTIAFSEGGTEVVRINSAGNLLVGATSGGQRLVLKGGDTDTAMYLENGATSVGYFGAAKGYNAAYSGTDVLVGGYTNNVIFANNSVERMRVANGGNVGIGTTSPGARLVVSDAGTGFVSFAPANASTSLVMRLGYNTDYSQITADSFGGNLLIGADESNTKANSFIALRTDATERMRIASNGDVSIGTSSALGGKLNVFGGYILVQNNAGTAQGVFGSTSNTVDLEAVGANAVRINTNGAERMRIDASGNVGIGTSSAATKLDVSVAGGMLRVGGASGNNLIQSYTGGGSTAIGLWSGGLPRLYSTGDMYFSVGATVGTAAPSAYTDAMTITSAGNVGIGVTAPLSRLDVREANRADSTNITNVGIYTTTAQATGVGGTLALGGLFGDTGFAPFGSIRGGKDNSTNNNYAGYLAFQTITNGGTLTERMRIDSTGRVMVGSTANAFGSKMEIVTSGSNNLLSLVNTTPDGGAKILFVDGSNNAAVGNLGGNLLFYANGASSERMRLTSAGNVGINTTTPGVRLDVVGSVRASQSVTIGSDGTYEGGSIYSDANWGMIFRAKQPTPTQAEYRWATSADVERMRIDPSGRMMVGRTSALNNGAIEALGTARQAFVGQVTVNANSVFQGFNAAGTATFYATGAGDVFLNSITALGTGPLIFYVNSAERMRISASGLLLVGTTTASANVPTGSIEFVAGAHLTSGLYGRMWRAGQAIGTATYAGLYGMASTYNAYYNAGWKSIGGGTASAITIDEGIYSFSNSNTVGAADAALTWTTRMTIDTSGNVGIGTASPAAKLDVDIVGTAGTGLIVKGSSLTSSQVNIGIGVVTAGRPFIGTNTSTNPLEIGTRAAIDLLFLTNTTERMRIDSSGNVGIGTSAPGYTLDVRTNASNAIRVGSNSNSFGTLLSWDNPAGEARLSSIGAYALTFGTNTTERMRINASGNLLVGTSVDFGGRLTLIPAATPTTFAGGNQLQIGEATNNTAYRLQMGYINHPVQGYIGSLQAYAGSVPTNLCLQGDGGNVVVGGATTVYSFSGRGLIELNGTYDSLMAWKVNNTARLYIQAATGGEAYIVAPSNALVLQTGAAVPIQFLTNNTEKMRINSNGNVGIGTSSPGTTLDLVGRFRASGSAASGYALLEYGTSATATNNWHVGSEGDGTFRWYNGNLGAGTERLRINSTGGITSSDVADAVGYKGLPQNSQTSSYTLALSDMGKHISITTGGVVIPANGSVAFPIGATIVVFNNSGSSQTISITTDTLRQAGTANTGSRTLAQYGLATLVKVTSTVWVATGNVT